MAKKAYLEITNACNLSCSFCHGTKRKIRFLTESEFTLAAGRLRNFADYLYFHLMGEPLLHPELEKFLRIADELGFKVILTTNGTLIAKRRDELLGAKALHKVSISLHCYEVNSLGAGLDEYLSQCFDFCEAAAERGIIAVMRLWNLGGGDTKLNSEILDRMHDRFGGEWSEGYSGYKLRERVYLEWGRKFEWPDLEAEKVSETHSCYGLREQIGVLCDGTVVPCCLDADGVLKLGNIFETELEEILESPRAVALKTSFERRCVSEELCRRCDFSSGF